MHTTKNALKTYRRLLTYINGKWPLFFLGLFSMAVIAGSEAGLPAILQPILDGTFVNKDPFYLSWAPLGLILLFGIRGIATLVSSAIFTSLSTSLMDKLRVELFTKVIHLPEKYFQSETSGELISKFTYDISQISQASIDVLNTLVKDSLTVLALSIYLFWLDWKLALLMLILIPATGLIAKSIGFRQKKLSRLLQMNFGRMTHALSESIKGHSIVKIFNGYRQEEERFNSIAKDVRQRQFKLSFSSKIGVPIVELLGACVMALVLYFGTQRAAVDQLTVGEFVAFFTALGLLFSPIKRLTKLTHPINLGLAASESVFNVLDLDEEVDNGLDILSACLHTIHFNNITYSYDNSSQYALKKISLTIQKGETVAFVGKSGSGKTTLSKLIPRFINPDEGEILIDHLPLSNITLESLRNNISLVSQDVILFDGTIAENISYAQSASDEDILQAAIAAHADEFIRQLPDGYNTKLGENGANLSGGQRQRIALARAFLKQSSILVLDEATSALDNQSENEIQKALASAQGKYTIIIIAHRLSTIRHANRIAVFENGQIVEIGTHNQLDKPGTKFFRLKTA